MEPSLTPRTRARAAALAGLLGCWLFVLAFAPGAPAKGAEAPVGESSEPGDVVLEPQVADLGVVPRAEREAAVFEVRNLGAEAIEVKSVEVPAGLEVQPFERTVPAGGTRELQVVLDASKVNGEVALPVSVRIAGRDEPLKAGVRAEIKNFLGATPAHARWIYVQGEEEGTILHTVWPSDGKDFRVVDVTSPHPDLEVSVRRAGEEETLDDRPEPQWVVETTLDRWARVGPITGTIEVETTHPVQNRLLIPVSGFVRPIMVATPQRGTFGAVEITEPLERYFHVKAFSTDPVTVESVQLAPEAEGFETRVETLETGREYAVWVTLLPDAPQGRYEGVIQVQTDDDRIPTLEIPVSAEVL
ncbi:MAG: hypothetical protein ACOC92_00490 [bacterium]